MNPKARKFLDRKFKDQNTFGERRSVDLNTAAKKKQTLDLRGLQTDELKPSEHIIDLSEQPPEGHTNFYEMMPIAPMPRSAETFAVNQMPASWTADVREHYAASIASITGKTNSLLHHRRYRRHRKRARAVAIITGSLIASYFLTNSIFNLGTIVQEPPSPSTSNVTKTRTNTPAQLGMPTPAPVSADSETSSPDSLWLDNSDRMATGTASSVTLPTTSAQTTAAPDTTGGGQGAGTTAPVVPITPVDPTPTPPADPVTPTDPEAPTTPDDPTPITDLPVVPLTKPTIDELL